jgi:hypothetical protein
MKRIPATLEQCAAWPLKLNALRLDVPELCQALQRRVVRYVSEVIPADEDQIADNVRA